MISYHGDAASDHNHLDLLIADTDHLQVLRSYAAHQYEIQSDVPYTAKKCFTLLEKTFKIEGGGYNIAQQPNILKY